MKSAHPPSDGAVPTGAAVSEPILSDSNAVVTRAVVNISGVTYQVAGISMMYVKEVRRTNWLGTAIVTALLLGAAIAAGTWTLGGRPEFRWVCYVFAGSCLAAPWLLRMKKEYSLIIATAAGERVAYTSKDQTYVGLLRSRIEQAMSALVGLDGVAAPPDRLMAAARAEPNPDIPAPALRPADT